MTLRCIVFGHSWSETYFTGSWLEYRICSRRGCDAAEPNPKHPDVDYRDPITGEEGPPEEQR